MSGLIKRFEKIIGKKQKEFSKKTGIYESNISEILSGKRGISKAVLLKLINANYSIDWLLAGEGEMFLDVGKTGDTNADHTRAGETPLDSNPAPGRVCPTCGQLLGLQELVKEKAIIIKKEYDHKLERDNIRLQAIKEKTDIIVKEMEAKDKQIEDLKKDKENYWKRIEKLESEESRD